LSVGTAANLQRTDKCSDYDWYEGQQYQVVSRVFCQTGVPVQACTALKPMSDKVSNG
jgi:hypothetical protein